MPVRYYEGVVSSDILLKETADGVKLVELWEEALTLTDEINKKRMVMEDFLGYRSDTPDADSVNSATAFWMRRAEHARADAKATVMRDLGVTTAMESYETHLGYTRDAEILAITARYLRGRIKAILEGDARNRYVAMLERFYTKGERLVVDVLTQKPVMVPSFYYGVGDTEIPPTRGIFSFLPEHDHFYRSTVEGAITPEDLEYGVHTVSEHGHNSNLIILCNEDMGDMIMAMGPPDVAPFVGMNRYVPKDDVNLNQEGVLMQISVGVNPLVRAIGTFRGRATIMISPECPLGYVGFFSHEGELSPDNPLQVAEPTGAFSQLRGIRTIRESRYPFVNTYWERYYSVSVRNRGNGAVMQVENWIDPDPAADYESPDWGDY